MFVCLILRHVFSMWALLGATIIPTIVLILKVTIVAQAQLYYTTGNNIQIPNFLLPSTSTITVNIPQGPPSAAGLPPTQRPGIPPGPPPPTTFRPPSGPGAFPSSFGPPPGASPGAAPPPPVPQSQTISVSITQPQVVNTGLDSCLGIGCYSLLPLAPSQPVIYTQPLYYSLWNWKSWAFGWRSGCILC